MRNLLLSFLLAKLLSFVRWPIESERSEHDGERESYGEVCLFVFVSLLIKEENKKKGEKEKKKISWIIGSDRIITGFIRIRSDIFWIIRIRINRIFGSDF